MTKAAAAPEPDFSLVLGGPLFQRLRRPGKGGDAVRMLRWRMLAIAAIAWLPLLLLSALNGQATGAVGDIPFLYDIEAHVRLLIALPVLIAGELAVRRYLRPVVAQFVERGIVTPEEQPAFLRLLDSTMRMRNSVVVEVALLVLVYTVGLWVWRHELQPAMSSWYAIVDGGQMRVTPAGYWSLLVSVPLFQFILLRWYLRLALWSWFLWRVSRLNLRLVPSHPDRAGGLGFLTLTTNAYWPLLFAQGTVLAGLAASQIFYGGHGLLDYKAELAGSLVVLILLVLCPLLVFSPQLSRAYGEGVVTHGALGSRYAAQYEEKWIKGGAPAGEALMGSADIQSLADLRNSYDVVEGMRFVPFKMLDVVLLAAVAVAPLLPLLLTAFSAEEIVGRLFKVLF